MSLSSSLGVKVTWSKVRLRQHRRLVARVHGAQHRVVDAFQEDVARDAGLLGQHGDLAQVLDDDAEHGVVRDLPDAGQLALAHPHHLARHGLQVGLDRVVQRLGAGRHLQQLAGLGHLGVARHRRAQVGRRPGLRAARGSRPSLPARSRSCRPPPAACFAPVTRPPSPNSTSFRSSVVETMVNTTSQLARSILAVDDHGAVLGQRHGLGRRCGSTRARCGRPSAAWSPWPRPCGPGRSSLSSCSSLVSPQS